MSQSITVANIEVPELDANGNGIMYSTLGSQLAPLTVDGRWSVQSLWTFDATGAYLFQSTVIIVFLLSSNASQALTLYTNFKNAQAPGTVMNVWYSTQTIGV
jgi:hypothetical protein